MSVTFSRKSSFSHKQFDYLSVYSIVVFAQRYSVSAGPCFRGVAAVRLVSFISVLWAGDRCRPLSRFVASSRPHATGVTLISKNVAFDLQLVLPKENRPD